MNEWKKQNADYLKELAKALYYAAEALEREYRGENPPKKDEMATAPDPKMGPPANEITDENQPKKPFG